jgi:hypothetical protein
VRDRRLVAFEIKLDGLQADSETSCAWVGPNLLTVVTMLPEADLAVEVHSTFVGHAGVPTCATHLVLGPVGYAPTTITAEHEHASLDRAGDARQFVYEHAQILIEILGDLGYTLGIDVPENAFAELERLER